MKKILLLFIPVLFLQDAAAQQVQWAKKYPGMGEFTYPRHIEAAVSGDLILTGDYFSSYFSAGIFLHKMNGAGTVIWADTLKYENPQYAGWTTPRASGMAVNTAGKIFLGGNFGDTININGNSFINYGPDNIFIAKYDVGGSMDWVQAYNDATLNDIYSDGTNTYFLISFSGPIIIFGQTFTSLGSSDLLILKLGPADNLIWSKQIHGTVDAVKFKVAPSGNMFLLGSFRDTLYYDTQQYMWSGGFDDYFLLKMNASGTQVYYVPLWASQQQSGEDLSITADESVIITGQNCWTNGCSAMIRTFDASGSMLFDDTFWGSTCDYGCGFDLNNTVVADPAGVWAMGQEFNNLIPGIFSDDWTNIGLTKYDLSGNILMRDTFLLAQPINRFAKDIAADNAQNLYMTAQLYGTAQFGTYTLTNTGTDPEFFVVKLSQTATAVNGITIAEPELGVYPNPAPGSITVNYECHQQECIRLSIRNVLGQIVFTEQKNINGNYNRKIDLLSHPKGVYFLEMDNGNKKEVRKIVLN